ncbi:MAG: DUF1501 domain-containing protein [Planctomycetes bacterium]|nr:DUF1501 domain-containing protein [Planctomycetota bacterium]
MPRSAVISDSHACAVAPVSRRTLLVAGGLGFCGWHIPTSIAAQQTNPAANSARARSTILIWLSGGSSHIDMWDLKPEAPAEVRGEFKPAPTSAHGVFLSEHLPLTAKQAHHLAIVRSLGHYRRGTGDHHAGYYYNLTGHAPDKSFPQLLNDRKPRSDDAPFIGSVVGRKSPPHPYLPQAITLPQMPGAPTYTRPGQFAASLGVEHDPLYVYGSNDKPLEFTVPAFELRGDVSAERLATRRALLKTLDAAHRRFDEAAKVATFSRQQEKAFSLLGSNKAKEAFDLSKEKPSLREKYGNTVNGMSMLMARRLAEVGVPFISVFWKGDAEAAKARKCKSGGGWDTHGNNFECLQKWLLPQFDRAFSALIEDLNDRGLLDQTLVLVNSEMGRKPKIGDPRSGGTKGAGRDHWTHCMSAVLAGGGVRGGRTYGSSDAHAGYPADLPVAPEDIAKTVYRAMGITDLTVERQGQKVPLLAEGKSIEALFS